MHNSRHKIKANSMFKLICEAVEHSSRKHGLWSRLTGFKSLSAILTSNRHDQGFDHLFFCASDCSFTQWLQKHHKVQSAIVRIKWDDVAKNLPWVLAHSKYSINVSNLSLLGYFPLKTNYSYAYHWQVRKELIQIWLNDDNLAGWEV